MSGTDYKGFWLSEGEFLCVCLLLLFFFFLQWAGQWRDQSKGKIAA